MTHLTTFLRNHWQLLILIALIFTFWRTATLQPLRVLIVFLHEFSHAAMLTLTGGQVVSFTVTPDEGGQVMGRGGSRFLTLTAGYLGSLLIGVGFLLTAIRSKWDQTALGIFGVALLIIAALYIRDFYALLFTCVTGIIFLIVARFLPNSVSDMILRVIGLSSMIYVPFDIFSDTISRSYLRSDARMLAEEFGGTTVMWGGLWLIISLAIIAYALKNGLGESSNIAIKKGASNRTPS